MFRYSNSIIDHVRDSIIQCMSVSGHQAYELGGVMLMEFQNEIPELTSLYCIFTEQYTPAHDSRYNNGIRRVEAMLRKYRTKLESVETIKSAELKSTKAELVKEPSLFLLKLCTGLDYINLGLKPLKINLTRSFLIQNQILTVSLHSVRKAETHTSAVELYPIMSKGNARNGFSIFCITAISF